jgi:Xaa-Pro aminopeptidase
MNTLIYASGHNADTRYLIGIPIPDAFFTLRTDTGTCVYLDKREFGVAQEALARAGSTIQIRPLEPLLATMQKTQVNTSPVSALALAVLQQHDIEGGTLAVPAYLPLDLARDLESLGFTLHITNPLFPERATKQHHEVAAIESALAHTTDAFARIEQILSKSTIKDDLLYFAGEVLTSERLKFEVEKVLLAHNLLSTEGLIIASAEQSAIPHHQGAGPLKANSPIICDLFPVDRTTGYFADMTRTYCKGEPTEHFINMYAAVKTAQERAIAAIRPGITGKAVHEICVGTFAEHGFATNESGGFIHGTGHGLGLEIHEAPNVNARNEAPLQVGNVVTVEPGLYYPKHGGVRIEDVVVITEDGCRDLTRYPNALMRL